MIIKSVYDDQKDILQAIVSLCGIETFDADLTYGNGGFYKHRLPSPNRLGVQRHARIFHSYFLVLQKLK